MPEISAPDMYLYGSNLRSRRGAENHGLSGIVVRPRHILPVGDYEPTSWLRREESRDRCAGIHRHHVGLDGGARRWAARLPMADREGDPVGDEVALPHCCWTVPRHWHPVIRVCDVS